MIGSTARVCGADVALEMTTQSDTKLPIEAKFVEKTALYAHIRDGCGRKVWAI